jgi:thiamine-phosphate pyrophosphorylase
MLEAGADYLAFGTIYPSRVKPNAGRAPLACLTQARRWAETLPAPRPSIVAIGGITATNAAEVAKAGADAVAIITGVFEATDIQTAAAGCAQPFLTGL